MDTQPIRNDREYPVRNVNGKGRAQHNEQSANDSYDNKDKPHFVRHFIPPFAGRPLGHPDLSQEIGTNNCHARRG